MQNNKLELTKISLLNNVILPNPKSIVLSSVSQLAEWDILSKKYKIAKLYFDYRHRSLDKSDGYTYVWDILLRENTDGNTGVIIKEPIKNIVGLRISQLNEYTTRNISPLELTITHDLYYMLQIKEFAVHGFNSPICNYQFSFIADGVILRPKNNGVLIFEHIMKEMPSTLSMTFYKPFSEVVFPSYSNLVYTMFYGVTTKVILAGTIVSNSLIYITNVGDYINFDNINFINAGVEVNYEISNALQNKNGIKVLAVFTGFTPPIWPYNLSGFIIDFDTTTVTGGMSNGYVYSRYPNLQFNMDVMYDDSQNNQE